MTAPLDRFSLQQIDLSFRSRCRLFLLRRLLRPLMVFLLKGPKRRVARAQVKVAGRWRGQDQKARACYGYYPVSGTVVSGHTLGKPFTVDDNPVLLWLHGGAFVLPAMPDVHLAFAERLCDALSAAAFLPDYRLSPTNPYPAALDDCEAAYRLLLESGVAPGSIVLGGDSAGGNLVFALLYRLRKAGLPMPSCAVAVSPALDMARLHGSPSRSENSGMDALLPISSLRQVIDWYLDGVDASDPEISPLLGDCRGLPPTMLTASQAEILRDDSVLYAHRLAAAGVHTELAVWPHLPHAFPLLEHWLPEASGAREQIATFVLEQLRKHVTSETQVNAL